MIGILLRILIPFVIAYFFVKIIRNILGISNRNNQINSSRFPWQKRSPKDPDTIDVCPNCGEVITSKHRCASK